MFPEGEAKRKLLKFLGENQPVDPQVRLFSCGQSHIHKPHYSVRNIEAYLMQYQHCIKVHR